MRDNETMIDLVRIMLKGVIVFCLVLLLVIGYSILKTTNVMATSSDLNNARSAVPNISGSRIDSCSLCHTSAPNLNPFGAAYLANGRSTSAFAAIAGFDSDGDGFTNAEELAALTFPGDASDFPAVPSPTSPPPTPTNTALPPTLTNTPVSPTATGIPPTDTVMPPTETPFPTASSTPLPPFPSPTSMISPTPLPSWTPTIQPTSSPECSGYDDDDHCGDSGDDDYCGYSYSGDDDHCEYEDSNHGGGSGGEDHGGNGHHKGRGHKGGGGGHGGGDDDGGGDHEGGGD